MRKIQLTEEFKKFDFLEYYKSNRSRKYIYRCLACHYIKLGKTYEEVSELMQYNRNSIISWVSKFNNGGIKELVSIAKGRGRKAYIGADAMAEIAGRIISLQKARSGGVIGGRDIADLVNKTYGVGYSVSGIYKLLSRIGMSWVSARSIHPKTNIAEQEAFKKTSAL